jgi:type VI secretion system secreted protein Hcp
MATDIFLKIGEIKGESTDEQHKDEIEVLAWSWGVTQAGSTASGVGAGAGRPDFSDLSITHRVDKASPNLMLACATGQHLKSAVLSERKAGPKPQDFLIVTMSDVMLTSVLSSASGADDGLVEKVGLQFATVDLEYRPQKPDGSLDAGIHFTYDLRTNKPG